jgi:hypothetical protein
MRKGSPPVLRPGRGRAAGPLAKEGDVLPG